MTPVIRCACLLALWGVVHAQVPVPEKFTLFDRERVFQADGSRGPFAISDRAIEKASERVWAGGVLLVRDHDYVVDARRALLTLLRDVARGTVIVVRFKQGPQVTTPIVRRRVLQPREPTGDKPMVPVVSRPVVRDSEEERKLTIGGHKSISVTAGSQHAVHQALQVRISGEVAEGVALLAVLSDRNLPIGERGGSQRLRELDRVFFQVNANRISATLGDLDVAFDETVFGRYRRQLQGARVFAHREKGQIAAFGAISRGRWETRRLATIEGYQGPYQISGTARQIVPESERVYLNGRLLKRGDGVDYTIDYERGHLSVAPEIPIGVESRMTVEYQVIDAGGHNRLMGMESQLSLGRGVSLGTTLIRETASSDHPAIAPSVGLIDARRQLGVVSAKYAPWAGAQVSGEVALSDRDAGKGRAFRLDGTWASRNFEVAGRFRQVGSQFEAFERLDRGRAAGRWGWQADTTRTTQREGDVSARYNWGEAFAISGEYGRRLGTRRTDRKSVDIRVPVGMYRYESLAHTEGTTSRHEGQLGVSLGMIRPGFRFSLENGDGDGVGNSSLFYAARPHVLPQGIDNRELIWQMDIGEGRRWTWTSELKYRHFRQRETTWRDSLRGWLHTHRAQVTNWKGWIFSGSYTRGTTRMGNSRQQAMHLGRVRLGHARPGLSHQMTYRVSSIGVQARQPVFIEVAPGHGEYIWEDANGDGLRDAEEFVPDLDGNYVQVSDSGQYTPARDGALGMRVELDFRRLIGPDHRLSALALDASLRAEQQIAAGTARAAPWDLLGFEAGDGVLGAHRDALVRLYLFRYHKRGSLRLTARTRHRVNRGFYDGAAEVFTEGTALGKWRPAYRLELENEFAFGQRVREGAGAFAYRIDNASNALRCAFRPSRHWHSRLGVLIGRDRERMRALRVFYTAVQAEIIRALPGRGRLRGRVDWTMVRATAPMPLFLGLANGNRHGQNWTWRLGIDRRFGKYVTAQAMYDGRIRPNRQAVHLARVEMRAVF